MLNSRLLLRRSIDIWEEMDKIIEIFTVMVYIRITVGHKVCHLDRIYTMPSHAYGAYHMRIVGRQIDSSRRDEISTTVI